jgi:uncharacterized protein YhhL (DUF1145 family)
MISILLKVSKSGLLLYWFSILVTLFKYFDTENGKIHVYVGLSVLAVHALEIAIFNKTLVEHSKNLTKDRLSVLLYGFLVPTELKYNASLKK